MIVQGKCRNKLKRFYDSGTKLYSLTFYEACFVIIADV